MAYRIERIIPGGFHDYLINLWEGNDLPSFMGSTKHAYLFDDKAVADRVAQRLAAKCPETIALPGISGPLPITYEVVEVSKHAWGQYMVFSYDKYQADFPNVVPAGRYDKLDDAIKHAETVTYKMVVVDSKAESRGFIYCNWPTPLTPDNCGASQLACNIINNTFLALDGFEAMRKQMARTEYKAEHFGAELARIVDRELRSMVEPMQEAVDHWVQCNCGHDCEGTCTYALVNQAIAQATKPKPVMADQFERDDGYAGAGHYDHHQD